jgi:two-component sensor histidine kinase
VELQLQCNRGYYELSISDTGQEWNAPRPGEKSTGLGLQLIGMLAAQMKATVQYKRAGLKNYCLLKFAKP